jgi:Fic family protein
MQSAIGKDDSNDSDGNPRLHRALLTYPLFQRVIGRAARSEARFRDIFKRQASRLFQKEESEACNDYIEDT